MTPALPRQVSPPHNRPRHVQGSPGQGGRGNRSSEYPIPGFDNFIWKQVQSIDQWYMLYMNCCFYYIKISGICCRIIQMGGVGGKPSWTSTNIVYQKCHLFYCKQNKESQENENINSVKSVLTTGNETPRCMCNIFLNTQADKKK